MKPACSDKEHADVTVLILPSEVKEEKTNFGRVYRFQLEHSKFCIYKYDDDPRTLYLSDVEVEKAFRGYGYGRDILRWVDCFAWQQDADKIRLWVETNSFVHDWYKRHGFVDMTVEEWRPGYIWMEKTR